MKNGMTCTELIDARNYECYDSVIETQCCESCNNLTLTLTGISAGKPSYGTITKNLSMQSTELF